MATNSQQEVIQGTSIHDVMSKASVDNWILRYKWPLLGSIALIVAAVLGHGAYRSSSEANKLKEAQTISQFITGPLKEFEDKKIEAAVVVEQAKKLIADSKHPNQIAPAMMKASDLLSTSAPTSALEILTMVEGSWMNSHRPMALLLSLRKAALQEDLGRHAEAIATLEAQLQRQYKVLETKIYFDLGRLSLQIGDKERAKKNFGHILETAPQGDEFAKMAKIYLQEIK